MSNLKRYEVYESDSSGNKSFLVILVIIVVVLMSVGAYFTGIKPMKRVLKRSNKSIEASFLFKKKKPEVKKEAPKKKVEKPKKKKPIDLTKTKIVKKEVKKEDVKPTKKPVKRVFGVKKVYSTGLGAGGSMDDAVVNKLGNTVNKEYDTTKATKNELKGSVVPLSKITRMPKLDMAQMIKPKYTKEMIENGIEGVIRAKILIDIDGSVKQVKILNSLGFGSSKSVKEACFKLKFKPALEDGVPVPVNIVIKFRLELRT